MYYKIQNYLSLIFILTKREILSRYKGSFLGLLWSVINPLFMLGIYTFVFTSVFNLRWSITDDSKINYSLIIFAGLIVFNFFSECVSRAPNSIVHNVNFIKKIFFPVEILLIVNVLAALFNFMISFLILVIACIYFIDSQYLHLLFVPIIFVPFIFFTLGCSWAISAIGVYFRDITQIISFFLTILLFTSPIFYPASSVPEKYQIFLLINPLSSYIEMLRSIVIYSSLPNFNDVFFTYIYSLIFFATGLFVFRALRKGFADVI